MSADNPLPGALPPLSGELSRRDLLRHFLAGNVLGDVVLHSEIDVEIFKSAKLEPGGLGKVVVKICQQINEGMPEHDMELGTDFYFRTPDEGDEELAEFFGDGITLVPLNPSDAEYLLEHMPALFLGYLTAEA